jgi:hypothetical protein
MTHPPDDLRSSVSGPSLEHDRRIVNGSVLALVAFAVVVIGIVWYALTDDRRRVAHQQPAIERSTPDDTVGYGAPRSRAPAKDPTVK